MNKVYKVIWSKAKQCYVVVSEIAKNTTKGRGKRARQLALAAIVGIGVAASTGVGVVHAAAEDYATEGYVDNKVNQAIGDAKNDILRDVNNIIGGNSGNAGGGAATSEVTKEYVDTADQANATAAANAQSTANEALDAAESAQGAAADAKDAADNAKDKADQAYEKAGEAKDAAADALTDAKDYTDEKVAQEVTDRNTAIATAKGEAKDYTDGKIDQEVTDRNAAIATAKSEANTYTDGKIDQEVTDRNAAIATAKSEANTYTDGKVAAEETRAQGAESALDGRLQTVETKTTAIGYVEGRTVVGGTLVVASGTEDDAKRVSIANGTISGLTNTAWTNPSTMTNEQKEVAATQGQLFDIASKGHVFKDNFGTEYRAALGTDFTIKAESSTANDLSGNIDAKLNGNVLTIRMNENPIFNSITSTASSEVGGVTVSTNTEFGGTGIVIQTDNTPRERDVSLTNLGLNNGGNRLSNIANGQEEADAVTVAQLNEKTYTIKAGANVSIEKTNRTGEPTEYTISSSYHDTTYSAGAGMELNGTTFSVAYDPADLTIKTIGTGDEAKSVLSLADQISVGTSHPISIDGTAGLISNLQNTSWSTSTSADSNKAATEGQLRDLQNLGWTVKGDGTTTKQVPLGSTLQIKGDSNYITTSVDNDGLKISLTSTPTFDEISGLQNLDFWKPANDIEGPDRVANIVAPGIDKGHDNDGYMSLISEYKNSPKAATESQVYNVVKNLDYADRYVTGLTFDPGTRQLQIIQNNAENLSVIIPNSGGGGGVSYSNLHVWPDGYNERLDNNSNNWYVTETTTLHVQQNGHDVYVDDAGNRYVEGTDEIPAGAHVLTETINQKYHNTTLAQENSTLQLVEGGPIIKSGKTSITNGQKYTIKDTAGNQVVIDDIASAEVLTDVKTTVEVDHEERLETLEQGFTLSVKEQSASGETTDADRIKPGDEIKITTNGDTLGNIKVTYTPVAATNDPNNIIGNIVDFSISDNPNFSTVTAGNANHSVVIGASGLTYDGFNYINEGGLNGAGKPIYGVSTPAIGSQAPNEQQASAAVNLGTFYPVYKAVKDGFSVGSQNGSVAVQLLDGNRNVGIVGDGNNITTSASGNNIVVHINPDSNFNSLNVGNFPVAAGSTDTKSIFIGPKYISESVGTKLVIDNLENTTWQVGSSEPAQTAFGGRAATENQLKSLELGLIGLGPHFMGDFGTEIKRDLGTLITVTGGIDTSKPGVAESMLSHNANIGVVSSKDSNKLEILLAKNLNLEDTGSVQMGNNTVNTTGMHVNNADVAGQGADYTSTGIVITRTAQDKLDNHTTDLKFAIDGISAGTQQITNVASGLPSEGETLVGTNAANIDDVNALTSDVTATKKNNNNSNLTVTTSVDANGKKTFDVALSDKVILGSKNLTIDGNAGTITNLQNKNWNPTSITSGQAATEDQLKAMATGTNANGGWGLTDDQTSSGTVKQDIGKTLAIKGATVDGNKNISTKVTTDGIEISLNSRVELGAADGVVLDGTNKLITAGTDTQKTISLNGNDGIITAGQNVTLNGSTGTGNVGDIQLTGTASAATISGLSNKTITWSATSPLNDAQKGIAATQGQLEAYGNADTDWRLVANPADGSDGKYKANNDGKVTLKVEDSKHTGTYNDVVIEDIASKAKLDAVEKDYVKNVSYATTGEGQEAQANKNKIVINQVVNGVANEVTFENTNDHVKAGTYTVANGSVSLDMVDVDGKAIADKVIIDGIASATDLANAKLTYKANGTIPTGVEPVKLSDGLNFTSGTNTVATVAADGVVTFDLKKEINLGADGSITIGGTEITDGTINVGDDITIGGDDNSIQVGDTTIEDGSITTNEVNVGEKTTINEDGVTTNNITVNGTNGSKVEIDGDKIELGDTTITGDSISTNEVVINGSKLISVDGPANLAGTPITRIKFADHVIATMEDGLKFSADKGDPVSKLLNQTLPINGDKNIETITTEGGVQVTLKDIVTLNDAQGNTTVVIDGTKGEAAIGYITINKNNGATINNLSNTDWDINNITSGQAATEDQLKQAVEDMTSAGMYFAGDGISATDKDSAIHRDLDEMLRVQGGAEGTLTMGNIGVVTDKENGILSIHLAQNIDLGKEGSVAIGSTTVNGETVNVGGEKGTSITETGVTVGDKTEITNGGATIGDVTIDGTNKEITVGDSTTIGDGNATFGDVTINEGDKGTINNLTNTQWGDNYTITSGQAATEDQVQAAEQEVINKGLNFIADDGTQIHKALGEELAIKGGATGELTQGNIGVNNKNGEIVVELAKDIDLGENGSITIGDTNITGDSVNVGGDNGTTITETGVTVGDKTEITNGGASFGDVNIDGNNKEITVGDKTTIGDGNVTVGEVTIDGDKKEIQVGDKTTIGDGNATFGDITINAENGGTINNLSNKTWDINNIVSGQAATEDQVKQAVESVTDAGMNFVGDDGTEIHKKLGETLAINGDQTNIHVESSNGGLVVSLDKDLKVDTITVGGENGTSITEAGVTVGDTTITGDSVNVGGENGTSITEAGVTVGDKTEITNGGATFGDVAIDGEKKEITVGEKTTIGDGNVTVGAVSIDGEKNVINNLSNTEWKGQAEDRSQAATEGQLEDAINDIKETGLNFVGDDGTEIHKNLGETLAINGDKTNIHVEKDGEGLVVSLDKDIKVDSIDVGDGKTVLNSDGSVSIADGKFTVDKDGAINSQYTEGGSITADGNGFVVDNSGSSLTVNDKGTTISNGDTSTVIDGSTITADNVTINGADGTVSITGADGAKADITVAKGVNNLAGNEQTRITYGDTQVATMADGLNFTADDEIVTSKKLNETLAINGDENITTKTTKDGVQVTLNKKLTGLEEIQVGDTIINGDSVTTENVITNNVEVGGPGEDGRPGKDGQITVNSGDGSSQVAIDGKDGISVKGEDGGVTIGTDGTIGIDGQDGSSASITVEQGPAGVKGEDGETITRIVYDDQTVATLEDGMKYSGDSGEQLKLQLNENVNIKGGADTENLTEGNIGVVSDGKDTLTVQLSKDLTGLESIETKELNADNVTVKETVKVGDNITIDGTKTEIQVGDTTVGKDGMTIKGEDGKDGVTVTKDKVDMAGNKVEGVADGTVAPGSMDAVNGSQLFDTNVKINKLSNRVNKVGAHAAALAALHPLDFDPDEKLTFSAGVGHYHSETAGAIGAFYRPDEKTMFSISGTMAEHDNMINAGVSFALDRTPNQTNSKTAMAKQILELTAKVEALTQANAQMMDIMRTANAGPKKLFNVTFPDLPKSHWAYGYVKFLADKGYVEGYPDGCFKGDRALTRYEFAAIVFRALQNGAPVDGNMGRSMDEFGPELENIAKAARFRVDRIKGVDDDRNKIERVRTNDEDDVANNDYRDVYGSKIAPPKTTK